MALSHAYPRVSAPRNWNQGKAAISIAIDTDLSQRPPELESRQSRERPRPSCSWESAPPGIGIKAKPWNLVAAHLARVSAPRNWNQGKARAEGGRAIRPSQRPPELESRQSKRCRCRFVCLESAPPGIGIKAKLERGNVGEPRGVSAPRNWNQGKAGLATVRPPTPSQRPPELESRQSGTTLGVRSRRESAPPGIRIKAKPVSHRARSSLAKCTLCRHGFHGWHGDMIHPFLSVSSVVS